MKLSTDKYQNLFKPIIGMPVSLAWKGYGSAMFLELGELHMNEKTHSRHLFGEISICPAFEWVIACDNRIICGREDQMPSIANGIKLLQGRTVTGISVADPIPELFVNFSGGYTVRSVQMRTGEPEWTIRYFNGKFIRVYNGKLLISNESERLEKFEMWENEDMQLSDDAASRWGIPIELPKNGDCINCKCFNRLDGNFSFLDYGVCSNVKGVFDGKVVHFTSACRAFLA